MRRMPASGLLSGCAERACPAPPSPTLTSALCKREESRGHARHPVDVEHLMVARRCFSSRSVPERISRLRRSSTRTVALVLWRTARAAAHLAHAHVVQRLTITHGETRRQRTGRSAELRREIAAHWRRAAGNIFQMPLSRSSSRRSCAAASPSSRQRFARDARGRPDGHRAADGGIDRV